VSKTGRIGVIGTVGTIGSGVYARAILARLPDAKVFSRPCPLFVPLVEEGWTEGRVPREVANIYLSELLAERIDTLVLGCTHYPLLAQVIADTAGGGVRLVDSAQETARVVQQTLTARGLRTGTEPGAPRRVFLVSDAPESFSRIGRRFLGYDIGEAGWVDFQA
jgi:glutamate racemase